MQTDVRGPVACGVALVLLLASGLAGPIGCDREREGIAERGEVVTFEIEGLRGLIERRTAVGESRVLAMGRAGRDLHLRVLWSDLEGNLLLDEAVESIQRPTGAAACVEGHSADALVATESGEGSQVYRIRIRDNRLDREGGEPRLVSNLDGAVGLAPVEGQPVCGLCSFDAATGRLSCWQGLDPAESRTWETGPLGNWHVLRCGDRLVLADWSADDEGWVTVRMGELAGGTPPEFAWIHSYAIAKLPSLLDPTDEGLAQPRFIAADDHVRVVFVDGTDWFTRLFVQRFPLEGREAEAAELIDSCRGTCRIYWAERFENASWIWYQDQATDWAERIDDDGEHTRTEFAPPPNVQSLGGGLFKLGLGNEVANLWALLAYER